MLRIIFSIYILAEIICCQTEFDESNIPKDTSFTVYSAFSKEVKNFPFIQIAQSSLPDGLLEEIDVVYSTDGRRKLRLDIFYPKNRDKFYPALILVHGGGWRSGNKSMQIPLAMKLAGHGFITAAIEYRLSPEVLYPVAIYDLKSAVRWLRANSQKYNIDTNKIAALGCSSGGHLVAILGVTNNNPKFEGSGEQREHSSKVQAVIDIDGILDFTDPAESGKDDDLQKPSVGKLWLGYSYKENPKIWQEASPVNYVDKYSSPFLFINSSIDRFHAGRDVFINKLNNYQIYSEIHTFPDSPHPFWLFHPWFNSVVNLVTEFLDKIFNYN